MPLAFDAPNYHPIENCPSGVSVAKECYLWGGLDNFRQGESRVPSFKAESYTMNVGDRFDPIDEQ